MVEQGSGRVPVVFRGSGENALASYNYIDIASGLGYVQYYATKAATSGANVYELTNNVPFSNNIYTGASGTDGTIVSVDSFETTTFNLPRVLKGEAYANIMLGYTDNNTGTASTIKVKVTLQLERDSVTTILAWADSAAVSIPHGSVYGYSTFLIPLTVTQKNIKRGDIIKLKVEAIVVSYQGGTISVRLIHDPQNRSSDDSTAEDISQSCLYLPFRIDA